MLNNICILILFSFLLISASSCGSGGVDCDDDVALSNAFSQGFSAVLAASLSFNSDASEASCQLLAEALDDYINSLEDFEDCAQEFGRGTEFRNSIDEAKAELSDLSCN